MAATPSAPWTQPPPSRWSAGRVVALVLGILILMPGLGLLTGGGVLLWADLSQRDTDGFLFSDEDTFTTSGYALVTERIDLSTGADWVPLSAALGEARVEIAATEPGTAIFAGIADVEASARYLDGVERTIVRELGSGATVGDEAGAPGQGPAVAPATEDFWVSQASGAGVLELTWRPSAGNWTLVVMNADGSAGVAVEARVGASVPALAGLAWALLAAGLVLTLGAVLLLVLAFRRPSTNRWPPYPPPPAGRPPAWSPPAPTDRTTAADTRPATREPNPPPAAG
jgi:hypothetical protein